MSANGNIEQSIPAETFNPGSALWRRRVTIVIVVWFVTVAGFVASFMQTPVYSSTAGVLVERPQQGTVPVLPNMDNEKKLVGSTAVAEAVLRADRLKPSVLALLAGLSVTVPVNTSILDITYTDPDAKVAQRGAQAFADAYLSFRKQQLLGTAQATQAQAEADIADVTRQLNHVQSLVGSSTPGSQEQVLFAARATSLLTELTQLEQRLQALPPFDTLSAGEVVEPAALPTSTSSPNRALDVALGLFLGLILGVGVALLQERFDDRVRSPEEVASILGARVLGSVPPRPKRMGFSSRANELTRGLTLLTPRQRAAIVSNELDLVGLDSDAATLEAFRGLRADFQLAVAQRSAKSVLVTSCKPEDGKTLTIANLGEALAMAGMSVVLVSADLRRPRLEAIFEQDSTPGLADVLAGEVALPDAVRSVAKDIRLLPAGSSTTDPVQLLSSIEMLTVVSDLTRSADLVLIDSPPMLAVADARVMVPSCDAVLFVVDATSTTRADLREARDQLAWVSADVLGALLINAAVQRRGYPSGPDRHLTAKTSDGVASVGR